MHYYNEYDKKVAHWLRNLIDEGHLPKGEVDERSIVEVRGTDIKGYTQCHFFAGIGGWPLALKLAGWPTDKHVWTGSPPCQPFSTAGQGRGYSDSRHLWPEFQRLIAECEPSVIFGEQVASKAGRAWLSGVRTDLEALGFRVGAADLCAASIGSAHIRQRLFWVADSTNSGLLGSEERDGEHTQTRRSERTIEDNVWDTSEGRNDSSRLAHASSSGLREAREPTELRTSGLVKPSRITRTSSEGTNGEVKEEAIGLAYSDNEGLQGRIPRGQDSQWETVNRQLGHNSTANAWEPSLSVECLDGKHRRIPVEPELRPLADGIPQRVVQLRAYGNAIVPQIAEEFIRAYLEVK